MNSQYKNPMKLQRLNWKAFLLWLALTPGIASAQVALDWQTIDAGGSISRGGAYSLASTIGNPGAGTLNGGTYSLAGGFWGGIAVQTPDAPALSIDQTGANIVLSWPVSGVGFQLQENVTLSITGAWSVVAQSRTTNTGRIFVTIPFSSGSRFYRLEHFK
jgi:hypothetical protein